MKRVIYLLVFLLLAAAFYVFAYPRLAGTGVASAQQAPAGNGSAAAAGSQSGRQGQAGQRTGGRPAGGFPTSVVVAVAQKQTMPITKSAVGFVESPQVVVLRTRADGLVVQQQVVEGQTVKAGDVLFKLDDAPIQAVIAKDQAAIAKDQANADSAQADLTRDQDLFKKQVDTQQQVDQQTALLKAAQAAVAMDKAQLQTDQLTQSYMTITAPIDGRVGTINTAVGNIVHASDSSATGLLTITDMSPLRVSFSIAEGDLDKFRNALATAKTLPVEVMAPGDTAPRATGALSFIDSSVDTASGTIVLKADVDNSAGKLWPGQYVTAVTQLGAYTDATTIPLVAVQESSAGDYLYAVGPDQKVKKQSITVVATVGDTAVVGSEIKPGDHVVVEGQLRLADGSAVKETVQGATTQVAAAQSGQGRRTGRGKGAAATGTNAGGPTGTAPAEGAAAPSVPPASNS